MTYPAPACDFFDDGLVHSHDWSRSTPPGSAHNERTHQTGHDRDETAAHDHKRHG